MNLKILNNGIESDRKRAVPYAGSLTQELCHPQLLKFIQNLKIPIETLNR